jgi:hypothetical protein
MSELKGVWLTKEPACNLDFLSIWCLLLQAICNKIPLFALLALSYRGNVGTPSERV